MKDEEIERLFQYRHLPTYLQTVSQNFHTLAMHLAQTIPPSAERTKAINDLWQSKNWAVVAVAMQEVKSDD